EQFEHELARSVDRIRDAIAPYTRFDRTQYDRFTTMEGDFATVGNDLRALRHRIGDDGRAGQPLPSLPSYAPFALGGPTGGTNGSANRAGAVGARETAPENGRPEQE